MCGDMCEDMCGDMCEDMHGGICGESCVKTFMQTCVKTSAKTCTLCRMSMHTLDAPKFLDPATCHACVAHPPSHASTDVHSRTGAVKPERIQFLWQVDTMTYVLMTFVVMTCVVMVYVVMAYIVMTYISNGLYSNDLCSYGQFLWQVDTKAQTSQAGQMHAYTHSCSMHTQHTHCSHAKVMGGTCLTLTHGL